MGLYLDDLSVLTRFLGRVLIVLFTGFSRQKRVE
jgi:hypothetical protein